MKYVNAVIANEIITKGSVTAGKQRESPTVLVLNGDLIGKDYLASKSIIQAHHGQRFRYCRR